MESSDGIVSFSFPRNPGNGITSLSDCESATYSLSGVDKVISACISDHHMIGKPVY